MNKAKYYRNDDDGGLTCRIEGKELVIRIGLDRLKFCLQTDSCPTSGYTIIDIKGFVEDMIWRMGDEDGQGQTKLGEFINMMAYEAYEQGSMHIVAPENDDER